MKLLGLLLMILCFSLTGIGMAMELRRKVQLLETALILVQSIRRELLLTHASSQRVIEQLMRKQKNTIFADCLQWCREQAFPEAWQHAIEHSFESLKAEYRSPILAVGTILGSGDLRRQEEALLQCEEQLREIITAEKEAERTRGKLCSSLGFLSGLMAAVILL